MNQLISFAYHVDRDQKYGRYMAFLHQKAFKRIDLPLEIKDEFSSLSATYPWSLACEQKGNVEHIRMENYLFQAFQDVFQKYWNYQYGIPCLYLMGKLDTFSPEVRKIPIFLLTLQQNSIDPLYQLMHWEDVILHYDKPCLLYSNIQNTIFFTQDKRTMRSYLRGKMLMSIQSSMEES